MAGQAWQMDNPELLQQIALIGYLNKTEGSEKLLSIITKARVFTEVYNRVTGQREIDAAREACILAIVDYIKKHPRASKDEMAKEIQKQVQNFAIIVKALS
ncbi:PREDICTED: uncharacterized protein LOC106810838 [Priapulus caudatus]|uniref:Uncharacterized protein LOC106810838 n=1 Tax=Priapulus caudatus TaxID=37621 RepID=A0ABM1EC60_PRICU|nr:PREDICTED: uncharacterized protein LOC106810838 [Priapulus caudatus]